MASSPPSQMPRTCRTRAAAAAVNTVLLAILVAAHAHIREKEGREQGGQDMEEKRFITHIACVTLISLAVGLCV